MQYLEGVGYVHTPPGEVAAMRAAIGAKAAQAPRKPPAKPRKYKCHLTPEQKERLREIQRIKGRIGGYASKGKFHSSNPAPGEERVMFKLLRSSRDTFQRCAIRDNKTMVMFLNDIAKALRANPRYADLFAEDVPATTAQTAEPTAHADTEEVVDAEEFTPNAEEFAPDAEEAAAQPPRPDGGSARHCDVTVYSVQSCEAGQYLMYAELKRRGIPFTETNVADGITLYAYTSPSWGPCFAYNLSTRLGADSFMQLVVITAREIPNVTAEVLRDIERQWTAR